MKKYRLLKSNLVCKRPLIVLEVSGLADGLGVTALEMKLFMWPCSRAFP